MMDFDEEARRIVKHADKTLLMTECRDIANHCGEDWNIDAKPMQQIITPWPSGLSKNLFLATYQDLKTIKAFSGGA